MQEHELWLEFSKIDLLSSKSLLRDELFTTSSYHCQQCAEKALKAFLIFHNLHIIKSHDLVKLVGQCKKIDVDFQKISDAANFLTALATQFRYPSEYDMPDKKDAERFIRLAHKIFVFVKQKIKQSQIIFQKTIDLD